MTGRTPLGPGGRRSLGSGLPSGPSPVIGYRMHPITLERARSHGPALTLADVVRRALADAVAEYGHPLFGARWIDVDVHRGGRQHNVTLSWPEMNALQTLADHHRRSCSHVLTVAVVRWLDAVDRDEALAGFDIPGVEVWR